MTPSLVPLSLSNSGVWCCLAEASTRREFNATSARWEEVWYIEMHAEKTYTSVKRVHVLLIEPFVEYICVNILFSVPILFLKSTSGWDKPSLAEAEGLPES